MKTTLRTALLVTATATVASAQGTPDWHAAFPGFKIAGNLYYVGTADLAVYLIRTPQGRPGATVTRVLRDGDKVELGGSTLVAHLTPGHTKGCTTWTMQVEEGGKTLNAVIIGSPNVNAGYVLVGNKTYPTIAQDYEKTFTVLNSLPVDLFLGAHGAYFGLKAKYETMKKGGANPFIDPAGYKSYVSDREAAFRKEWERQKQTPPSPGK